MSPQEEEKLLERRDRALGKMDAGHQALVKSLEGLGSEEAFLGSRWSVWEVLKHLDSEGFVEALEADGRRIRDASSFRQQGRPSKTGHREADGHFSSIAQAVLRAFRRAIEPAHYSVEPQQQFSQSQNGRLDGESGPARGKPCAAD